MNNVTFDITGKYNPRNFPKRIKRIFGTRKKSVPVVLRNTFQIKNVHVNESKGIIVVVFTDGGKEIVRCHPDDHFNVEIGFSLALARHIYGSRSSLVREINSKRNDAQPKNEQLHLDLEDEQTTSK